MNRLSWMALSIHRPGFGFGRVEIGARRIMIFNGSCLKIRFLQIFKPVFRKDSLNSFIFPFNLSRSRLGGLMEMVSYTRSLGRKRKWRDPAPFRSWEESREETVGGQTCVS